MNPVITVNTTIMDGTVVRWYRTLGAAENHRPVLSASRHGVKAEGYLTDIPDDWVMAARQAHATLSRARRADMRHLATHRNEGPSNGPLKPVQEVAGE